MRHNEGATLARTDHKWAIVVDGDAGCPYDRIWPAVFDSPDELHYVALRNDTLYLVEEALRKRPI